MTKEEIEKDGAMTNQNYAGWADKEAEIIVDRMVPENFLHKQPLAWSIAAALLRARELGLEEAEEVCNKIFDSYSDECDEAREAVSECVRECRALKSKHD